MTEAVGVGTGEADGCWRLSLTGGNGKKEGFCGRGNEFGNLGKIDLRNEGGGFARFIILGPCYRQNTGNPSVVN